MAIVYLNGRFLPVEQACVSVMDRGFLFGDGVYEVIPAYGGRLFHVQAHLQRLDQSLSGIRLANPLSHARWQEILEEVVRCNGGGDLGVYLQVTRGPAPKRDHAFPAHPVPTVFVLGSPIAPLAPALAQSGVSAVTVPDMRWQNCHLKAITLLPNVLLRQLAIDQGAAEAILIRDGQVTEGAASNVFLVSDANLMTPPKGPFLLPGVTRDVILTLAVRNGIEAHETPITEAQLRNAQEIWVTSSTREILPVTELDGQAVGNGHPGPLWQRMMAIYQAYKEAFRAGRVD